MNTPDPPRRKLNLGAGRYWSRPGWVTLDHNRLRPFRLPDQAWSLPWPDAAFDTVFSSHMIEHISQFWIERTFSEINRVMCPGGVFRVITPDLEILCRAYLEGRTDIFRTSIEQDGSIREEFGMAQLFLRFLYTPGYDNFLLDSSRGRILGGYGHIFSFDYALLSGLLSHCGFVDISRKNINDSAIPDHRFLRTVPHDFEKEYSLVVECRKGTYVPFRAERSVLFYGPYPYEDVVGCRKFVLTSGALWVSSRIENVILWGIRSVRDILKRLGLIST